MPTEGAITAWEPATSIASSAYYISPTAGGGAHAKGSYSTLTASTAFAADGFVFQGVGHSNGLRESLIDLATGAAASETVIVANMYAGHGDNGIASGWWARFPLGVASGTRLSARLQCEVAGTPYHLTVYAYSTDELPSTITGFTCYGFTSATSIPGVSVDPGGTVDTKGSYSTIASSLANKVRAIAIKPTQQNTGSGNCVWKYDVSTGAAASEVVLLGDITMGCAFNSDMILDSVVELPIEIAAATRIAVRSQCSINDATDRLVNFQIVGIEGASGSGAGAGAGAFTYIG
jgi:hypothetical protein